MADQSDRVDDLVAQCLRRIEEEGSDALDAVCNAHPEQATRIRSRVARLIEFGLIDTPTPRHVGPYELLRRIGFGGMGEVFLARQVRPVVRLVALKLIKRGMDSERAVARFELERQTLAMLNHDGIAKIYDAGATDDGQLFFAMELVDGDPITEWCARQKPSIDERLALVVDVCRAVQHAHQAGIIHRDLKPSNILVSGAADSPVVKVIDFGLAKATDAAIAGEALTQPGLVVGTLDYLSPEQTGGAGARIDTRSDVYALGTLLYLLVTGEHPLPAAQLHDAGLPEAFAAIRDTVPARASARVAGATSSTELSRRLRGDLDWIIARALEKEPERRYSSVGAFADDIERHLRHLPVEARPPSARYIVGRFVRRHRRGVAAAAVIGLLTIASFAVILSLLFENKRLLGDYEISAKENERSKEDFAALEQAQDLETRLRAEEIEAWPATPAGVEPLEQWLEAVDRARNELSRYRGLRNAATKEPRDRVLGTELTSAIESLERIEADGAQYAQVQRRLEWAKRVARATVEEHTASWTRARRAIREHADYGGLDLPPQIGLVPIGPDPRSTLWEFAVLLPDTDLPVREPGRPIAPRPDHCPIVVLIPPTDGPIWLGAQSDSPDRPNHDRATSSWEQPPFQIELPAYFLGKHELSEAQWHKMTRLESAEWSIKGLRPARSVRWIDADRALRSWGLTLPTEAQWERAVRAGTSTPWFTGEELISHAKYANLGDLHREQQGYRNEGTVPWSDGRAGYDLIDGWLAASQSSSPVIRPNPFGLHHLTGNVGEPCLDPYAPLGDTEIVPGRTDGLRRLKGDRPVSTRVRRGGSFMSDGDSARSAFRLANDPYATQKTTGVRVARAIVNGKGHRP